MSVPESIRAVPRPKNTVVVDSGHEGVLRYAVRERAGVKYGPGGRSRPVNGRVIGHIIDGEYVPIIAASEEEPAFLSFGPSAFVNSMSTDLYQDLQKVFAAPMAQQIMVIASIKAMVPWSAAPGSTPNTSRAGSASTIPLRHSAGTQSVVCSSSSA